MKWGEEREGGRGERNGKRKPFMLKHEHRTPAGRILFVGIFKVEILSVEKFRNYLDADCSLQVSKPSFNLRKKQTKFCLPESSSSGPGASKNVLNSLLKRFG